MSPRQSLFLRILRALAVPGALLLVLRFQDTVQVRAAQPSLEPIATEVGGTFCKYLAFKNQLPRRFFRDCAEPTCDWNTWNEALRSTDSLAGSSSSLNSSAVILSKIALKPRVVVSFAHNGFGNQLWEHSVAFMIAEALHVSP